MIKGPLPSRQPGCGIRGGGYAYALRSLAQSSAYSFGSAAASCALHRNTKIRAGWRAGQQLHGLRTSRRRGADPGPVCLPREKMRGARFCAVAFLSGVPMPQPGLHAPCVRVPAWPPNTATAQFARHIHSQMAIIRHEICDPAAQGKALSSAEPHTHYTQTIR